MATGIGSFVPLKVRILARHRTMRNLNSGPWGATELQGVRLQFGIDYEVHRVQGELS